MTNLQETIIKNAKQWVGERERPGNMGFENPDFDRWMRLYGFQNGWAWCCVFTRGVWVSAYTELYGDEAGKLIRRLFSPNVQETIKLFKQEKQFSISTVPVPGALICFQNYKKGLATSSGHIGIVTEPEITNELTIIHTIEGNTNKYGSREGDRVAEKKRVPTWYENNGLRLRGFINPVELQW